MLVENHRALPKAAIRFAGNYCRFNSVDTKASTRQKNVALAPMNIIVLPITSKKNFFFYNYHKSFDLNTYLQLRSEDVANSSLKDRTVIKSQIALAKIIAKLSSAWENMGNSKNSALKWSYDSVQKLLKRISWFETCLSSVPSRNTILREVNTEIKNLSISKEEYKCNKLTTLKEKHANRVNFYRSIPSDDLYDKLRYIDSPTAHEKDLQNDYEYFSQLLKPIPLYYPKSVISKEEVISFLENIQDKYYREHVKKMVYCFIGLPLTLPFIALPIVPNIPGLYLCYRIYCHYKVITGLKHLDYLLNDQIPATENQKNMKGHLEFVNIDELNNIYLKAGKEQVTNKQDNAEKLLIDEEIIENIINATGLNEISRPLHNSLVQERTR